MNSVPHPRWSAGRGRGNIVFPNSDFLEDRPARNPGTGYVKRDPISGYFKLHVRSIPPNWNEIVLRNVFSRCGDPKSVYLSTPRVPNLGRWGFVEFEHFYEANSAVQSLNNNVVLNIQVSFAREKPFDEENDPVLQLFASEPEDDVSYHRSTESLVDPRTLMKTVKNDITYSTNTLIEDFHKPLLDEDTQRAVEEALFKRILDIYKEGEDSTAKCNVCEVKCSMTCAGCTSVFYCSEQCQTRDWTSHLRNCKVPCAGAAEDTTPFSRGSGDYREAQGEFTNGCGLERENRSESRPYRGDQRNSRDFDRGSNRDRDQRQERNGNDHQNRPVGKKTLFEERKSKMAVSCKHSGNDRGFQVRHGQNSQKPQNSQETRGSFQPTANSTQAEGDWGSENQDNDVKDSSAASPGLDFINKEKAFLQEIEPIKQDIPTSAVTAPEEILELGREANKVSTRSVGMDVTAAIMQTRKANVNKSDGHVQQVGAVLKVLIYLCEDRGLFWVQADNCKKEVVTLTEQLKEHFNKCTSNFSPVKGGICGILYEGEWYRCQITSMEPLNVLYIDFGYPEEVEASRLFELSPELKALPPFAFKIKLLDETPQSFMENQEGGTLVVKLVEKVDNYWMAQVVDVKIELPAAPETLISNDPPASVTTHTPTVNDSRESQNNQVPTTNGTQADLSPQSESPQKPSTTFQTPPEPPMQQPYPPMFDATKFTTVITTYPGDSVEKDTYYVGATTTWETIYDMCTHFKGVIQHCQVLTPKHGSKGLALYMGEWYRVKIVSLTPLLAYYIDCGNIEELQPGGLRKCPETHRDIPPLVHKIKLAPGTREEYFNLPNDSELSVMPISWLADSTILVEVESENYSEVKTTVREEEKSSPTPTAPENALSTAHVTVTSGSQAAASLGFPPVQVDIIPNRPSGIVDLLQEKWEVSFVVCKPDLVKNSVLGQVFTVHIPTTAHFAVENENYQRDLSSLKFDPNFKPSVGEVVGLRCPSGDFERCRVLQQQDMLAYSDKCCVTRSSQIFKLPESIIDIPSLAAVFTLHKKDPDLLNRVLKQEEIIFHVVKVTSKKGRNIVYVTNNNGIEGELRTWDYEPLETPDPLAPGDSVSISNVIDSNTLLVTPVRDLEIQQAIQVDCRKMCENFKSAPKQGDYVSFYDKESDEFFRCRVDKIDKDVYTIYSIDNATYHQANLDYLHPLPKTLRSVPCRITQLELKDVGKVDQTEQAQGYLSHIVQEDKCLTIADIDNVNGKVTLTVEGEEETLNKKLKELLVPEVLPDSDGKLTILSLPELGIPLNQEFTFYVCQTEPLYVQLSQQLWKSLELINGIQEHCATDSTPYNPCQGELCLAKFEGEWYRCRCLRETNTGVSVLMLVDYGTIFKAPTSDIRRIVPEMLTMPSIAIPCKIHGLPDSVSPALRARLDDILKVNDKKLSGTFVAEKDGCYEVVIESVKKVLEEMQ